MSGLTPGASIDRRSEPSGDDRRTVLFITGEYPPMVGGLADHTRRLQGALGDAGRRSAVLTSADASPDARTAAIVRRWDWSVFERVRRAVRSYSPAVIHLQFQAAAYGMHPAICLVPFWLRVCGGPPTVVQMHDLRLPYLLPKAGPLRRTVVRTLLRWSSGIILSNQADFDRIDRWLDWAAEHGLTPAGRPGAHLIPIGANVEDDPPPGYDRSAFRHSIGIAAGTTAIAFFGLANQSKGLDDLLRAVRSIRDAGRPVRLLIVGGSTGANDPTNRAARSALDRAIGALDLVADVTITGTLTPAWVSAYLRAADLAALPYADGASFRRGSLLAAIAHGLPIVTTCGPDPADRRVPDAELRDGDNCRLVPIGDPAALTAAIGDLAAAPVLRERLAAGARALAPAFAWDRIAARSLRAYEEAGG